MDTAAEERHRAADRDQAAPTEPANMSTPNISAPTIWVMCALVLTVLLIRACAALHLYVGVPILALNFIGFVIWVQYYRR